MAEHDGARALPGKGAHVTADGTGEAARPEILAAATGAWPGDDPRPAASAGFAALAEGHPPVPLTGVPVEAAGAAGPATGRGYGGDRDNGSDRGSGHDRGDESGRGDVSGGGLAGRGGLGVGAPRQSWRIDTVGLALSLMDGLHADLTSYGWRLTRSSAGSRDRDVSRMSSALARSLEACEEYGRGFAGRTLLSLPGPWALLRRLSLPDGNPALADPGARRDVVQAYALGAGELLERFARALGTAPRVRLVEPDLDAILTGALPTISGLKNLPAVPDAQVTGALRSFTRRTGADTILALPALASVTIAGKPIAHRALAAEAGLTALAVGLPGARPGTALAGGLPGTVAGDGRAQAGAASPANMAHGTNGTNRAHGTNGTNAAALRPWEEIAQAHESGTQVWLHLPAAAGRAPDRLKPWLHAVSDPWHRVGMNAKELTGIGILTGAEPLARNSRAIPDDPAYGAAQYRLAAHLAQALREEHE